MKALQHIKSEDILAIDIETVRLAENFFDLPEAYQSAWEYKNKQNGEIPTQEELQDLWVKTSSLYAEFSKVCAVSIAYIRKGALRCKSYVSVNEAMILKALADDLLLFQKSNKNYRLVAHAGKFFDYPFLCKRYMINGMPIPSILDESDAKPWDMRLLDTNELWRSFGTGAGSSLQALCVSFDVPVSKVDLVGDQVGKAYYDGELERIGQYCNLDAIALMNVFRKMKYEPIFNPEEVVFVNQGEVMEPVPFLQEIRNLGYLTNEHKQGILNFCEELSLAEITSVRAILRAALIKDDGTIHPDEENFILDL